LSDEKTVTGWPKVEGMEELAELALNLHWCWNHASDEIWESLDSELRQSTQNPWVILRTVSEKRFSLCWPTPNFVNVFRIVNAITLAPAGNVIRRCRAGRI
jgi:starch phosphorylase